MMAPGNEGSTKPYACTACTERKVKCDKREPCTACSRSRLPCKYRSTPPSQHRRKRKATSSDGYTEALLERLRAHEATLQHAGVPFQRFDDLSISGPGLGAADRDGHGGVERPSSGRDSHHSSHLRRNHAQQRQESSSQESLPYRDSQRAVGLATMAEAAPQIPGRQSSQQEEQQSRPHRGVLLSEDGGKRYYEHGFIGIMGQEYRQTRVDSSASTRDPSQRDVYRWNTHNAASDMLLFAGAPVEQLESLKQQHPPLPPILMAKYWSIFLENVHPLTKIVHAPSTQQLVLDNPIASDSAQTSVSRMTSDAMKYSISACAVLSLTDKECQAIIGEPKDTLLQSFQLAARQALSETSFLKVPDIDLLCAYVLLLTSLFHNSDRYSLWVVMGSTIRMAQSQGLHRDGATLGLTPFKTEMRRRVWWYIVSLDQRLTELTGSESCLPQSADTLLPSNSNDADLRPDMTTAPREHSGATEMTFCLSRYEIVRFLYERGLPASTAAAGSLSQSSQKPSTGSKRDRTENKTLSRLENSLEERFLRFCDPVIPVQFLATMATRSTICKLRQMALHSIARPPDSSSNSSNPSETRSPVMPEQANKTFQLAARNLQYDNLIHFNGSLRGFLWHVHFSIPWGAPVYILKTLAGRGDWDPAMQAAWTQIEELYEHHPEFIEDDTDIHLIVRGLTLQAWFARETFLKSTTAATTTNPRDRLTPPIPIPSIIPVIQEKHQKFLSQKNSSTSLHNSGSHQQQQNWQHLHSKGTAFANRNLDDNGMPQFAELGGLDAIPYPVPDFIDPLFVAGDWPSWAVQ